MGFQGRATHTARGQGRLLRGGDAELAAKEERVLDSWRHGGECCWQGKLGVQKQEVGKCVGSGSVSHLLWPEQATLTVGRYNGR